MAGGAVRIASKTYLTIRFGKRAAATDDRNGVFVLYRL
jgi:hypothetical protein